MGRGTILSGGEEGLYQVKLDFGMSRMAMRILQVQLAIDGLDPVITEKEAFVEEARAKWEAAKAALDAAVEAYAALLADPAPTPAILQQREQARRELTAGLLALLQDRRGGGWVGKQRRIRLDRSVQRGLGRLPLGSCLLDEGLLLGDHWIEPVDGELHL